jgi:hypothetical protein
MSEISYIANKLNKNWVKGFKQLGNQVKALTKNKYIQILPRIQDYYITDKADGLHSFLMINKSYIKYITSENVVYLQVENTFNNEYIFDCEYIDNKLYIFDVILYNGENISKLTFNERYQFLLKFQEILTEKKLTDISIKQFFKLTVANYQNSIVTMYKKQKDHKSYNIDGLIFIEMNMDYNRTINLKWKPIEFLTIDFLAIKTSVINQYILTVGIKAGLVKAFNMHIEQKYHNLVKTLPFTTNTSYIPVPFYNSLIPNIYYYTHNTTTDLHGCIIELSLNKDMRWIFHKIRTDRTIELKTGSYYGNNYKIAEQTLASVLNPLDIKDLVAPYNTLVKDIYFTKQDTDYKFVKNFNNYVKNLLIMRQKNTKSILDLASGRGGDINKYISAGIKNALMLEIDTNAIEELINRKYTILDTEAYKSCNIVVLQMDLNTDYKKNISTIKEHFVKNIYVNSDNILENKTNVIFCHFALHYFLNSEKSAQNIISFVSHYLEKNGLFIVTIFDGQRVFDLLKRNNGVWKVDKKYMIKYLGKQPNIFSGFVHKIDVLLPLSNVPYQEPLIDLYALDKLFKKNNIYRVEEKNFNEMLPEYASNKNISFNDTDTTFIGLYKYVIYKKN